MYLFVFRGSSTCVIILVGLSVILCSPRFPPRVLRILRGIRAFRERSGYRVPTLHHLGIMSHVDHDFGASPLRFLA